MAGTGSATLCTLSVQLLTVGVRLTFEWRGDSLRLKVRVSVVRFRPWPPPAPTDGASPAPEFRARRS